MSCRNLVLIMGDQLGRHISHLRDFDKDKDVVFMGEIWDEATYVKHHKKKIAFLFTAMRHFAKSLEDDGYSVRYRKLNDKDDFKSFTDIVRHAVDDLKPEKLIVTYPGEYRVLKMIHYWKGELDCEVEVRPDDHFLSTPEEFQEWANDGRKELTMEFFYRVMRKKHNILMENEKDPVGGEWNFDKENRKPPKDGLNPPEPTVFQRDGIANEVIDLVKDRFSEHFGDIEPFYFAKNRDEALEVLKYFIDERLPLFGDYQDAMVEGEPWMYHSHLSFYINCGMLSPMECIEGAVKAYENGDAPINAVEGFVRQILGWREYVRGIYWLKMPEYADMNALDAKRELPWFFWTGETKMNCMKQCITETKENAYAHHIQRLMVLGNFCLLTGIDPKYVNEWYLIVYADAFEWVELPNVTGMILHADGGVLGSKPYAAGGNYINKMSNYCQNCEYKISEKVGKKACPFNYLYWNFLDTHKDRFKDNQRMRMIYSTLGRMSDEKVDEIRQSAKQFLENMDDA